ncbi:MAG: PilZ domain-containing protein [Gammaproteobacteria bacterium]|nr:PilZ domain-containing protein [Gammaproteobacteria bacterium]
MSDTYDERRRFHRIATDKPITVTADGGSHDGVVQDVSLRGVLLAVDDGWQPATGMPVQARIRLDDGDDCCIEMHSSVAHVRGNRIGLQCTSIDVDSAARLKRMVELNLADQELLERDLAEMLTA